MAIVQLIGHAHHMPIALCVCPERTKAKTTRRTKSVNVAVMNWRMALIPRSMPSATNLADTAK